MVGTSLVVQWLRLCGYTAGGVGSTPGHRTSMQCGQKKKRERERENIMVPKKTGSGFLSLLRSEEGEASGLNFGDPGKEGTGCLDTWILQKRRHETGFPESEGGGPGT